MDALLMMMVVAFVGYPFMYPFSEKPKPVTDTLTVKDMHPWRCLAGEPKSGAISANNLFPPA